MRRRPQPPLVGLALAGLLALAGAGWHAVADEPSVAPAAAGVLAGSPPLPAVALELPEPEAPAPLLEEPPGTWALSGRVTDDLGRPLPGATVAAGARKAVADESGMFVLEGLAELAKRAELAVVARADWHVSRRLAVKGPVGSAGPDKPLVFELDRGASLSGRVLDADGRGVAGARVLASHGSGSFHAWGPDARVPLATDEQCTDWNGYYLFECLQPGEWSVTAEAIGRVGCRAELSVAAGDVAVCETLVMPTSATVNGRVLDLAGLPVARAELRFQRLESDEAEDGAHGEPFAFSVRPPQPLVNVPYPRTSAADGSFRATDLAPGRWRVVAVPAPGMLGPAPGAASLTLADGGTAVVDVQLTEPRHLRGVLLDEAGLPVAGLDVTAHEQAPFEWRRVAPVARTDALGRFSFDVAPDALVDLTAEWQVRHLGASLCVGPGDEEPAQLQLVSLAFYEAACSLRMPDTDIEPP